MTYQPVVIIGAPRSGTNILRDTICKIPGISSWPCDEINYIWRHGNLSYPSDEIPATKASSSIKKYIHKSFAYIKKKTESEIIIEKTCANSLRVPFVEAIFPNAKYIFIIRDGIDVTSSAKKRWTAKIDITYILKKVPFVPIFDLPYYAIKYLWVRLYKLISREKRLAVWGPSLNGMHQILQKYNLNEVCALQWQRCVQKSEDAFSNISSDRVFRVRYENFVNEPKKELSKIQNFIGKKVDPETIDKAINDVKSEDVGKGRKILNSGEVKEIENLIKDTLQYYDYL